MRVASSRLELGRPFVRANGEVVSAGMRRGIVSSGSLRIEPVGRELVENASLFVRVDREGVVQELRPAWADAEFVPDEVVFANAPNASGGAARSRGYISDPSSYRGPPQFAKLARFAGDGTIRLVAKTPSLALEWRTIALDSGGALIAAGALRGKIDLGTTTLGVEAGVADLVVAKYPR